MKIKSLLVIIICLLFYCCSKTVDEIKENKKSERISVTYVGTFAVTTGVYIIKDLKTGSEYMCVDQLHGNAIVKLDSEKND